jgi:hypothetical protein
MPKSLLFILIGLVAASASTGLGGLFYYLAILNFNWYMAALYGPLVFLSLYLFFIAYAMFNAALVGEPDVATEGPSTF